MKILLVMAFVVCHAGFLHAQNLPDSVKKEQPQANADDPACNSFLAFAWQKADGDRALVCSNYSPHDSQCFVHLPFADLSANSIRFTDLMSNALYDRDRNDLLSRGLFLDLPPWGYHVFEVSKTDETLNS